MGWTTYDAETDWVKFGFLNEFYEAAKERLDVANHVATPVPPGGSNPPAIGGNAVAFAAMFQGYDYTGSNTGQKWLGSDFSPAGQDINAVSQSFIEGNVASWPGYPTKESPNEIVVNAGTVYRFSSSRPYSLGEKARRIDNGKIYRLDALPGSDWNNWTLITDPDVGPDVMSDVMSYLRQDGFAKTKAAFHLMQRTRDDGGIANISINYQGSGNTWDEAESHYQPWTLAFAIVGAEASTAGLTSHTLRSGGANFARANLPEMPKIVHFYVMPDDPTDDSSHQVTFDAQGSPFTSRRKWMLFDSISGSGTIADAGTHPDAAIPPPNRPVAAQGVYANMGFALSYRNQIIDWDFEYT